MIYFVFSCMAAVLVFYVVVIVAVAVLALLGAAATRIDKVLQRVTGHV